MAEQTTVVLRKWPKGEHIALFPYIKADLNGNCSSYQHTGQHGAADFDHVVKNTEPAYQEDAKDLIDELTNLIGYKGLVFASAENIKDYSMTSTIVSELMENNEYQENVREIVTRYLNQNPKIKNDWKEWFEGKEEVE
jgi:16S rRNA G1207 methylase RsmC